MIRIYDTAINLLAEIDDYESLIFQKELYTHGKIEVQINLAKNNVQYLAKNNIIVIDNQPEKSGIIKVREIKAEDSETLSIIAYTFDYLFTQRIIVPGNPPAFDSITAVAETAIKHYIDVCVTNPTDTDRKIDLFNLTTDQTRGALATYDARFDNLGEFLDKIRSQQDIGIECSVNTTTKKVDIDVLVGDDHTLGTANPVVFSNDYDNLRDQTFYETDVDEKTFAYVAGEGELELRAVDTTGTGTGLDRKELFVDTNLPLASLPDAGDTELAQYKPIETFEGEVIGDAPFKYEEDYNLGDIVSVTDPAASIQVDTRITTATEVWEPNNYELEIAFGNNIPNTNNIITKKTKKEVK